MARCAYFPNPDKHRRGNDDAPGKKLAQLSPGNAPCQDSEQEPASRKELDLEDQHRTKPQTPNVYETASGKAKEQDPKTEHKSQKGKKAKEEHSETHECSEGNRRTRQAVPNRHRSEEEANGGNQK